MAHLPKWQIDFRRPTRWQDQPSGCTEVVCHKPLAISQIKSVIAKARCLHRDFIHCSCRKHGRVGTQPSIDLTDSPSLKTHQVERDRIGDRVDDTQALG